MSQSCRHLTHQSPPMATVYHWRHEKGVNGITAILRGRKRKAPFEKSNGAFLSGRSTIASYHHITLMFSPPILYFFVSAFTWNLSVLAYEIKL